MFAFWSTENCSNTTTTIIITTSFAFPFRQRVLEGTVNNSRSDIKQMFLRKHEVFTQRVLTSPSNISDSPCFLPSAVSCCYIMNNSMDTLL